MITTVATLLLSTLAAPTHATAPEIVTAQTTAPSTAISHAVQWMPTFAYDHILWAPLAGGTPDHVMDSKGELHLYLDVLDEDGNVVSETDLGPFGELCDCRASTGNGFQAVLSCADDKWYSWP